MKKIILFVLSVALFISCFAFNSASRGVVAGAGMGTDEKIENAEELAELLQYLLHQGEDEASSADSISSNGAPYSIENLARSVKNKYKSATVSITTTLRASSYSTDSEYSGGIRESNQKMDRELVLYLTDEGTYFRSKGSMTLSQTVDTKEWNSDYQGWDSYTKTSEQSFKFDIEIFTTKKKSYIYIREWVLIEEGYSMQIRYENAYKWIEMPKELVEDFVDVDSTNRSVLSSLGEFLEILIDSDEVDKDDKIISIDEHDLNRIFEEEYGKEWPGIDDYKIKFKYDLSSPTTPYISSISKMNSSQEFNKKDEYGDISGVVTVTNKSDVSQQLVVQNIDNTIVEFDKDCVELDAEDVDDFEDLFIIDKRRGSDD